MPAYNFKPEFAAAILSGQKAQTVRRPRKRPTRPGDVLTLYTGQRTPDCRLLATVRCTEVVPVEVFADGVRLQGRCLFGQELHDFARADGFDSAGAFCEFFARQYGVGCGGGPDVLDMEIVMWEPITRRGEKS